MKPFSEACEQNKKPILKVITKAFSACTRILEIGSGTGQHAVYFGEQMPLVTWQTSDRAENHAGIRAWLNEVGLDNVLSPIVLDVDREWPESHYEGIFSANTAHIMSWPQVEKMFAGVGRLLRPGGVFCLYGPFNYNGRYTSDSNQRFDGWLKARDPDSGIRDFEKLDKLAQCNGLLLKYDQPMPENNHTLVWHKRLHT